MNAAVGAGVLSQVVLLPQLRPEATGEAAGRQCTAEQVEAARTAAAALCDAVDVVAIQAGQ